MAEKTDLISRLIPVVNRMVSDRRAALSASNEVAVNMPSPKNDDYAGLATLASYRSQWNIHQQRAEMIQEYLAGLAKTLPEVGKLTASLRSHAYELGGNTIVELVHHLKIDTVAELASLTVEEIIAKVSDRVGQDTIDELRDKVLVPLGLDYRQPEVV